MSNITDYVKEYGDKTIKELEFNEVDSLILSQLSYLKYDGFIPVSAKEDVSITLGKLARKSAIDKLFLDERYEKVNRGLFDAVKESKRFKNVKLKDYVNVVSEEAEEQFSAVTFEFDDDFSYIAFRGTDDSIVGWKEDFNMGFLTPVPAQEHAKRYLDISGSKCGGRIIVGGHSKGGNLAEYASMYCKEEVRDKIDLIFSHDGPGFLEGILDSEEFLAIKDRIRKTVPRSSIVGMILCIKEDYDTVSCRNIGILQHDPFNWNVDGTEFKRAEDVHETIKVRNASLNQWISSLGKTKIKDFTEILFSIIVDAEITNLNDFAKDPTGVAKRLTESMSSLEDNQKKMMIEFMSELGKIMNENFKEYMLENITGLKPTGDSIKKVLRI